jgi:hypothetical protein
MASIAFLLAVIALAVVLVIWPRVLGTPPPSRLVRVVFVFSLIAVSAFALIYISALNGDVL